MYTAKQGDTWDKISYEQYGSEYYITDLIIANQQYVDIVIFDGGENLVIPDISTIDTSYLPPWRQR